MANPDMPFRSTYRVGRLTIKCSLVTQRLPDNEENDAFCAKVERDLLAKGICAFLRRSGGWIAVYRDRQCRDKYARRLDENKKPENRPSMISSIVVALAYVQTWYQDAFGSWHWKWSAKKVQFCRSSAHHCSMCGATFWITYEGRMIREVCDADHDRNDFPECKAQYMVYGKTGHFSCCADCLPNLRAALRDDEAARMDDGRDRVRLGHDTGCFLVR